MTISGALLYLAQRDISLGTSYAAWPGIGTAGTFLVGMLLIIGGVIARTLAH